MRKRRSALQREIYRYNAERLGEGEELMSQRRLAELTGLDKTTVNRHARLPGTIKASQLLLYAKALRCPVEDLVEGES